MAYTQFSLENDNVPVYVAGVKSSIFTNDWTYFAINPQGHCFYDVTSKVMDERNQRLKVDPHPNDNGTYLCRYKPASPGMLTFTVSWKDKVVFGPYKVEATDWEGGSKQCLSESRTPEQTERVCTKTVYQKKGGDPETASKISEETSHETLKMYNNVPVQSEKKFFVSVPRESETRHDTEELKKQLLRSEHELKESKQEKSSIDRKEKELHEQVEGLRNDLNEAKGKTEAAKDKAQKYLEDLTATRSRLEQRVKQLDEATKARIKAEEAYEESLTERVSLEDQLEKSKKLFDEARRSAPSDCQQHLENLARTRHDLEEAARKQHAAIQRQQDAEDAASAAQDELAKLKAEMEQMVQQLEAVTKENQAAEDTAERYRDELTKTREQLQEEIHLKTNALAEVQALNDQQPATVNQVKQLTQDLHEANKLNQVLEGELKKTKDEKECFIQQIDAANKHLKEMEVENQRLDALVKAPRRLTSIDNGAEAAAAAAAAAAATATAGAAGAGGAQDAAKPPVTHCLLFNEGGLKCRDALDEEVERQRKHMVVQGRELRVAELQASSDPPDEVASWPRPVLVLVPTLATSRVASSIESTMGKLTHSDGYRRVLLVFHPRAPHDKSVPSTRGQLGATLPQGTNSSDVFLDFVFDRSAGNVFDCKMNTASEAELQKLMSEL